MKIPTKEECLKILKENKVPNNIISHTKKIFEFSLKVCEALDGKGIKVNKNLVAAAALLHDIKKLEPGEHEIEGAKYIESCGYPEVAVLIKKHGLRHSDEEEFMPVTWEEKIIFYSDKRVKNERVVSIDDRFEYIKQRYKREDVEKEIKLAKDIEKELLGNKIS